MRAMSEGASAHWSGDGTTASCGIDFGDANKVAAADTDAARTVINRQCREELDNLSVDIDGNETVSIRVEARDGTGFVLDGRLQSERRPRLEAEQEAPDGPHEEQLERRRAGNGHAEPNRLRQWCGRNSRRPETHHEREHEAWRQERRPAESISHMRVRRVGLSASCVALTCLSMAGVRNASVAMPSMAYAGVTVTHVPGAGVREPADCHCTESHGTGRQ